MPPAENISRVYGGELGIGEKCGNERHPQICFTISGTRIFQEKPDLRKVVRE